MAKKVILSADATCDIGPELTKRYSVQLFYYHIQVGERSYVDKIEIQPEELYKAWREENLLPKTAAVTPAEYAVFWKKWPAASYDIVHVNLGSALTSSYQNALLAAEECGNVWIVDSGSLSTGSGHLVAKAGEQIAAGATAEEVSDNLMRLREKTHASFILDTLEFMAAGGRCSQVMAFGANLLKLKPCIRVDNQNGGAMSVGKKYRGSMEKVLAEYVRDQLQGRDCLELDRLFITHSGSPQSDVELVRAEVKKYADFGEVIETRASGTISSHCGPRTLGILYMER